VSAPLMEAEQDGSIGIQDLSKVVMVRKRLGLAKERLVPFEATRDVPDADDRPCAFHGIERTPIAAFDTGASQTRRIASRGHFAYSFFMHAQGGSDRSRARRWSAAASAYTFAGVIGLCGAAVVALLVVVPPLLSAFDGGGGPACWSIRLNRGSAASIAKTRVEPLPHSVTAWTSAAEEGQRLSRIVARAAVPDASIDSPADRSPETRRGPPNARLA
jgi:hypothetical protein